MKKRKEYRYNINDKNDTRDCRADYCNIEGMMEGEKISEKDLSIDVSPDFFKKHYPSNEWAGKCPETDCSCLGDLNGNLYYEIAHTLYALRKKIEDLEDIF